MASRAVCLAGDARVIKKKELKSLPDLPRGAGDLHE